MQRRVVILDSAKQEFQDIKAYVKRDFGAAVWNTVNAEYKAMALRIGSEPQAGHPIDELQALGIGNIRYALVRQTRVVYEFDERMVVIHMFIGTRRDFRSHLFKRLFNLSS